MDYRVDLETERLWLREFKWKDVPLVHKLHQYPEVAKYNTLPIPTELTQTRDVMKRAIDDQDNPERMHYSWAILHEGTTEFIGEAGMNLAPERYKKGEIYYNLLPEFWGRGYATELVKGMISFGFEALDLHRIEAGVAVENVRSIHVLEKAGMLQEGIRRKILPLQTGWSDNYAYAILESDPREY